MIHRELARPGNPQGKPPGARHATTIMAEQLMEGEAEAVVRTVVAKAKRGDMRAARLVLDRIAPLRRGRPVAIKLPEVRTGQWQRALRRSASPPSSP
jgi:hypothetical protein